MAKKYREQIKTTLATADQIMDALRDRKNFNNVFKGQETFETCDDGSIHFAIPEAETCIEKEEDSNDSNTDSFE